MEVKEGYMTYLGFKTYYRIVGKTIGNKKPLVFLHGGPGSTHNYFELLDSLAEDGRMLIMYDQLGCGLSTTPSQPELWHSKTWINELMALREHLGLEKIHILGQSWGGMLAIEYLCDYQPKGVNSVILSSTLPASSLWKQEQRRLITYMSESDQKTIYEAESTENYESEEYLAVNDKFMHRHSADTPTSSSPEPLRRPKIFGKEAYLTAWGPNEYSPTGTLKNWDYRDKLDTIKVPTLVTSGTNDLCTPLIAKTMYDSIPNAQWELFAKSRHMPFVDERIEYEKVLLKWLNENDGE